MQDENQLLLLVEDAEQPLLLDEEEGLLPLPEPAQSLSKTGIPTKKNRIGTGTIRTESSG